MPFKTKPPFYEVWVSMRDRCNNPTNRQYKDYGGRGITICRQWDSYHQFASDMGSRPEGFTLDRIDNNGNYEPGNCRWASRKEQQRNQRVTRFVTIEGAAYKAADLADLSGLKTDTIISRASAGLPYKKVIAKERTFNLSGLALGGKANGARQKAKTHCPKGHSYEDAYISPQGYRTCRTCHKIKTSRQQSLKRERRLREESDGKA